VTDGRYALRRARRRVQPGALDAAQWTRDLEQAQHTQLDRVQASARVWLSVLTTLLTLLGSVVLFKGGSLVTGVTTNGSFQVVLIVLVSLVFASAVIAVIFGGQATWGGLRDVTQSVDTAKNGAQTVENGGQTVESGAGTVESKTSGKRSPRRRRWFGFAQLLAFMSCSEETDRQGDESAKAPWESYRDWAVKSACRRRVYLHASRTTGVVAAGLIALLAILAVIAGTVSPPPSDVIVVHHGQVTCGPVSDSAIDTGVTQVTPVSSC
jgi:hypothetical protein